MGVEEYFGNGAEDPKDEGGDYEIRLLATVIKIIQGKGETYSLSIDGNSNYLSFEDRELKTIQEKMDRFFTRLKDEYKINVPYTLITRVVRVTLSEEKDSEDVADMESYLRRNLQKQPKEFL
ncbi:MAG TPA: hypothetical protein VJZ93_01475 [Candidatus Nanoarchaeia archaeon]|nr:hypothetical protein [Candidatus Nanoarchaeia archaeon]